MTQAEKADLIDLRTEVREGFRETRELIETRHVSVDVRLRSVERVAAIGGAAGTVALMLAGVIAAHLTF